MSPDPAVGTALYVRRDSAAEFDEAVRVGADGVSLEVSLLDSNTVVVGDEALEDVLAAALAHGLRVELRAGTAFAPLPATPLLAATVATLVSSRLVRDEVRLVSFDHGAAMAIGRGVTGLAVGLQHLVTLHRGAEYAARSGAAALHPLATGASADDVRLCRAAGVATHAWTLVADFFPATESAQLRDAARAGVDSITLTDPSLIAAAKESR